jgi:hypothetical protein
MASKRNAALESMIEETTVDAYDDEQLTGMLDLPLPIPPSDGTVWIDAYRHWAGR